eukprot:2759550-Karenia_brevis.AAC.1
MEGKARECLCNAVAAMSDYFIYHCHVGGLANLLPGPASWGGHKSWPHDNRVFKCYVFDDSGC